MCVCVHGRGLPEVLSMFAVRNDSYDVAIVSNTILVHALRDVWELGIKRMQ